MPIHCSDLIDIIYQVVQKNIKSNILECVGPELISFKEILKRLSKLIDKRTIFISLPLPIASLIEIFSNFAKSFTNRGST